MHPQNEAVCCTQTARLTFEGRSVSVWKTICLQSVLKCLSRAAMRYHIARMKQFFSFTAHPKRCFAALLGALVLGSGVHVGTAQAQLAELVRPPVKVQPVAVIEEPTEQSFIGPMQPEPEIKVGTIPFDVRPPARKAGIPRTRWQHMEGHALWTRAALAALKDHGKPLVDIVPRDIANWCPAYPDNTDAQRRAFWVGYMSALAKHESTYKPWAVGGGGKWYGLLQILPATARGYKCNVGTGEALKSGAANLSCAVRIMAFTVNRDGVIHGRDRKWRGVSADWGPMRNASKRRDMSGWLKRQSYCQTLNTLRPKPRP